MKEWGYRQLRLTGIAGDGHLDLESSFLLYQKLHLDCCLHHLFGIWSSHYGPCFWWFRRPPISCFVIHLLTIWKRPPVNNSDLAIPTRAGLHSNLFMLLKHLYMCLRGNRDKFWHHTILMIHPLMLRVKLRIHVFRQTAEAWVLSIHNFCIRFMAPLPS